ncbi:MAG: formate dehydrogenase subunit delta [Rhodoblastus sp.]|nr:formate dehydrogenase subunit delta [Rhodoblastus sp.]
MSASERNTAKLARMAGQIADFFRAYPDAQAASSVAEHINKFWTPKMRAELLAMPPSGDPLVARAMPFIKLERQ